VSGKGRKSEANKSGHDQPAIYRRLWLFNKRIEQAVDELARLTAERGDETRSLKYFGDMIQEVRSGVSQNIAEYMNAIEINENARSSRRREAYERQLRS
jgi:hypothetical protein